jgi:hypothetical protein
VLLLYNRAGTVTAITLRTHMMLGMWAAAVLFIGGEVPAQTIYRQTDAAGRTTFTDRPAAGAIVVPYEAFPRQERSPASLPRIATGLWRDVAKALSNNASMRSIYAARIDFKEATRRLQQARENRHDGWELRPGERTDGAGTTAMDQRYQRRQQRLERAVVAAERRTLETSLVVDALSTGEGENDANEPSQP